MRIPRSLAWVLIGLGLFTAGLLRRFNTATPVSPYVTPLVGSFLFGMIVSLLIRRTLQRISGLTSWRFMTLMGGILGKRVPVAEIQGLPFAFTSHAQVHAAMRGPLGDHIRAEMAAQGIHGFRDGVLENGFRHIVSVDRPVHTAADLAGYRMRIPDGRMFDDAFRALGATQVVVNIRELYGALAERRVDGQENPLAVVEVNRLYEVSKYVSLTAHMWSGFNLIGNLAYWRRLPEDVQQAVNRAVATHMRTSARGDLAEFVTLRGFSRIPSRCHRCPSTPPKRSSRTCARAAWSSSWMTRTGRTRAISCWRRRR